MKIGPLVLAIRAASTMFETRVAGASELSLVMDGATLVGSSAFVVQVGEKAAVNKDTNSINQLVDENFAVIVALATDNDKKDKLQLTAYDTLFTARKQLLSAILGLQMSDQESLITYVGGEIVSVNRAYLWYQFEFNVQFRLDNDDGVQLDVDSLPYIEKIYNQFILAPNSALPLPDGTTLPESLFETNLEELVTWPRAFDEAFGPAFDSLYKQVNEP